MRRGLFAGTRSRGRAAAGVIAAVAALAPAVVAAEPSGGRVDPEPPRRVLDTRTGERVTHRELWAGVLTVTIVDAAGAGTAVIHPCDEPAPADEASFVFRRADVANGVTATIVTAEASCLTSTTPVHLVVDDHGTVAAWPETGRAQYVPAVTPEVLADGTVAFAAKSTQRFTRTATPDPSTVGLVVALDALATDAPGYAQVWDCDQSRPMLAPLSATPGVRRANIAVIEAAATAELCVYSHARSNVRVTVLGELRTDGPDPAALPPSWRYVSAETAAPSLHPITPVRVLDTRSSIGRAGTAKVEPREVVEINFGDRVGPQTSAVVLNVTVAEPETGGHLTVYPCGGDVPVASNLNFVAGETVPNLTISRLGPSRTVCLSGPARTHVIADLSATLEADGGFRAHPVEPDRVLDTRRGLGRSGVAKLAAGETLVLQVGGARGVPTAIGAATLNVTVTEPEAAGFVTVFPCDADRPTASNLNYLAGQTVANLVTSSVAVDGTVCLFSKAATHLVADIGAWYGVDEPTGLVDVEPYRLLDTRNGTGRPVGIVPAGEVVTLQVTGRGNVPASATAAVLNLTAVLPAANGYVTAWPCGRSMPTVSNLNYVAGEIVPNLATVKLSDEGTVCLYSKATTHLLADVTGYLTDETRPGTTLTLVDR